MNKQQAGCREKSGRAEDVERLEAAVTRSQAMAGRADTETSKVQQQLAMRMRQLKDLQSTNSELLSMHARLQQEHAGTVAQLSVSQPSKPKPLAASKAWQVLCPFRKSASMVKTSLRRRVPVCNMAAAFMQVLHATHNSAQQKPLGAHSKKMSPTECSAIIKLICFH